MNNHIRIPRVTLQEQLNKSLTESQNKKINPNNSNTMYKIEKLDTDKFTTHHEGEEISLQQVKNIFKQIADDKNLHSHRVGITCDVDRREKEHNTEFDLVVCCANKDKANELEGILEEMGFDAGDSVGNVHLSKSKKVYIYKKSRLTIESIQYAIRKGLNDSMNNTLFESAYKNSASLEKWIDQTTDKIMEVIKKQIE